MNELWNCSSREVYGESVLFTASGEARLLFAAAEILRVHSPATGKCYLPGRDYLHAPGTAKIIRTAVSELPVLTEEELRPKELRLYPEFKDGTENAIAGGIDGKPLIFNNRDFFARRQVEVDYIAEKIDCSIGSISIAERLPRLHRLLEHGEPVAVSWLGDSISEGYNSSKFLKIPPEQPPFAELVAEGLRERYGCRISLRNHARSGSGSAYPLSHRECWLEDHPDLLVIAYGMNDLCGAVEKYLSNLAEIINLNRERSPHTEYLLAASMRGNPEWVRTPPEASAAFAAALRRFAGDMPADVGFADLHAVWDFFARRKDFYDLTGNGVNHPNDYGHRILSNGILSVLFKK